jgi:hypothetical protein
VQKYQDVVVDGTYTYIHINPSDYSLAHLSKAYLILTFALVGCAETDEDATLGQRDLNEASGAANNILDRQTIKFLARVREHPSQILRCV